MIRCRLNVIFAERGIKKGSFAKELGISPGTLSGWCSGEKLPMMEQAYRVAVALDLNVMEIWVLEEKKEEK